MHEFDLIFIFNIDIAWKNILFSIIFLCCLNIFRGCWNIQDTLLNIGIFLNIICIALSNMYFELYCCWSNSGEIYRQHNYRFVLKCLGCACSFLRLNIPNPACGLTHYVLIFFLQHNRSLIFLCTLNEPKDMGNRVHEVEWVLVSANTEVTMNSVTSLLVK